MNVNTIEKHWYKILKRVLTSGKYTTKDDAEILEYLGYYDFIPNPLNDSAFDHYGFPTSNPEFLLDLIRKGVFEIDGYPMNAQAQADYVESLNKDESILCFEDENSFVYTYPERLQAMRPTENNVENIFMDQIDVIVHRLITNLGSNRAVANVYNAFLDAYKTDIPCLQWVQATVRNNKLRLHVIFRSNDIGGAWPSNMLLLMYLGMFISYAINVETQKEIVFEGIDYHVSSAHIYKNQVLDMQTVIDNAGKKNKDKC